MKKLMNILMLSCKKASELIEKRLSGKLTPSEKMQLSMHLKMCKACSQYGSQQELIDQALRENCGSPVQDAECEKLKAAILERLRSEEGK